METPKIVVCSLASGSNGNAYYIECGEESILVDCGIGYRDLIRRIESRKLNIAKMKAIFITHEHSDHIRGIQVFNKHWPNIDIYMTEGTYKGCKAYYKPAKHKIIEADSVTEVGVFRVHSFSKPHDVIDPCSYRIEVEGINVGVFTDIGAVTPALKQNLAMCQVAFLESNYDNDMLWNGKYHYILKKRITDGEGHLSNMQAAQLVTELMEEMGDKFPLHTLVLSHLSADNNHPRIALKAFEHLAEKITISTASRFEAGKLLHISTESSKQEAEPIIIPEDLHVVRNQVS